MPFSILVVSEGEKIFSYMYLRNLDPMHTMTQDFSHDVWMHTMMTFTFSSRELEHFEVSRVFFLTNDLAGLFFLASSICPGTPSFDLPTPHFVWSSNLNSVPGSGPGTES